MAAGGAQASNAGGDGGQGMEDVCAGLPTQRKESNICPISNATLGSSGTELLVRRKLTFSCVYELSLWFTLGLIFSPHSSLLLQSAILHFKGNNIFLHFLLCWDFLNLFPAQDEQDFFPSSSCALSFPCHTGSGCCLPMFLGHQGYSPG